MELFGLTLARTKTLELRQKQAVSALASVPGSRGWWPLIRELTTGGWQRNEDVPLDTALSNPTLFSVITLIASDIAKLRLKLVEQDASGLWHEVESAAFSPVLRKPNHYQTRIDFFKWWLISVLVHGNTYALKARDGRGVVVALYILDPTRVQPLVSTDGSVFYQLVQDELSRVEDAVVVPAREIIHDVETPLFHPLVGTSPIYAAGWPAIQGLNIRRQSDLFFSNGSKPGGVLTAPGHISQETATRLKDYWESKFSGDNIGKIAVLGDGLKYEAMALTAEQSQLVEQLGMTDEDIAKCFHMPRYKVGVGPDPTYSNIEALTRTYYSDCLQERVERIELRLDYGLELVDVPGRTLGVEFERDDLFQMDTLTRVDVAEKALRSGASPNETRKRWLDLPPVAGGETPYLQEQNWPIQLLAERELPTRQPTAPADMPPAELTPDTVSGLSAADLSHALDVFRKGIAA